MRIVAVGEAERAEARALVFEYIAATQGERGRPVPADPAGLPELLRAELDNLSARFADPGGLFLAYDQNQACGCVGLAPRPEPGRAEVTRLYVRPEHRGRGVARALMNALLSHAHHAGFTQIDLDVMASRVGVVEFYRRLGFIETGTAIAHGTPMVLMSRPA